jgi:hypothetical protein
MEASDWSSDVCSSDLRYTMSLNGSGAALSHQKELPGLFDGMREEG